MKLLDNNEAPEEDPEPVPDRAERFVYIGGNRLTAAVRDEWLTNDTIDLPEGAGPGDRVQFGPGDELPPDLGREVWPAFHDVIAALDSGGTRVDMVDEETQLIASWKGDDDV